MSLHIREFSGSTLDRFSDSDVFSSQIEQLDRDSEEAEARVCQLVGDILVRIGEHNQLLRFEQLELRKENTALKQQITQLKMVHVAAWEAVLEEARANIRRICEKIKVVAERLQKKSVPNQEKNLNSGALFLLEHKLFESWRKNYGFTEMCEDWKIWLENLSKVDHKALENYPGYKCIQQNQMPEPSNSVMTIPSQVLVLEPIHPMMQRFTQTHVDRYRALERETIAMRVANAAILKEKEAIVQEHSSHISSLKGVIKLFHYDDILGGVVRFDSTLKDRISQAKAVLPEMVLFDEYLKRYIEEALVISKLVQPLIATVQECQTEFNQ